MIEGYCYKIIFADGCWYWGTSEYKNAPPEKDGYYGSPKTHKQKWKEPHSKIVLKVFYDERSRVDYERVCILPDLNDPKCLNEHAWPCISRAVHEKFRGVPRTEEVKSKISKALKGKKLTPDHIQKLREAERPLITPEAIAKRVKSRKGYRQSEETRQKIGDGNRGKERSQEVRIKISESVRGYSWYNNGKENIQSRSHPGAGWQEGRILGWESPRNKGMKWYHRNGKLKMFKEDPGEGWVLGRPVSRGKRYYNNGTDHVLAFECPGEGWIPGRLSRK
jgi:hypothetical protein